MQTQGEKLKNLIKALGLKQEHVAGKAGITAPHLSRMLRKNRYPPDTLARIADVLGLRVEYVTDLATPFNRGDTIPESAYLTHAPAPKQEEEEKDPYLILLADLRKRAADKDQDFKNDIEQLKTELSEIKQLLLNIAKKNP